MKSSARIATELLDRLGIDGKPDLDLICRRLGLRVLEVSSRGFDGVLVRSKSASKGIIGIRESIREHSRKRFTVAHEIGHFAIPSHKYLHNTCESDKIDSYDSYLSTAEREANRFAAELLLPSRLVGNLFRSDDPSLELIFNVAQQFSTSLSATARRLVDLREDGFAVIWQANEKTIWLYKDSKKFPFFLDKNMLPVRSGHSTMASSGASISCGFRDVDPTLWLDQSDAKSIHTLLVDSLYLPGYKAMISLLWIPEVVANPIDEDELLEELDPSSFTVNRRRWIR